MGVGFEWWEVGGELVECGCDCFVVVEVEFGCGGGVVDDVCVECGEEVWLFVDCVVCVGGEGYVLVVVGCV